MMIFILIILIVLEIFATCFIITKFRALTNNFYEMNSSIVILQPKIDKILKSTKNTLTISNKILKFLTDTRIYKIKEFINILL
ncbi:hypothetical protein IJ670_08270, partial [bacterium]|nr:hypothetical protein [bacterium]